MKPSPGKTRNTLFNALVPLATIGNLLCAVLIYVVWSEGQLGAPLYELLNEVPLGIHLAAGASAAVAIVLTAMTWLLSYDVHRLRRPRWRIYLVLASFGLFVAAYLLGAAGAPLLDIVEQAVVFPLVALLLPLLVAPAERLLGRALISSAWAVFRAGSITQALALVRLGLALKPQDPAAEDLYGRCMAESGRMEPAMPYLERSLAENPNDADLLRLFVEHHARAGDTKKELELLERLQSVKPTTRQFERLVDMWRADGQTKRVLDGLRGIHGDDRKRWQPLMRELLFELRDFDGVMELGHELEHHGPPFVDALDCFEKVAEIWPRRPEPLEAMLELHGRTGNRAMAIRHLEGLLALQPDNTTFRRRLIAHYREVHQPEAARSHLAALVDSGEANLREKIEVANELFAVAEHERLEKMLRGDKELMSDPRGAYLLAAVLFENGRMDAALRQVAAARVLGPESDIRSLLTSIETRAKSRIMEEELRDYADRVHASPDDLELQLSYVERLVATHAVDKAVMELDTLLARMPDQRTRIMCAIGDLLEKHGNNFRLMSFLADLRLREGDHIAVFDLYCTMARESLTPDDVLREGAEKVLREMPDYAPALLTLAKVAARDGDDAASARHLSRYLECGGEASEETTRMVFDSHRKLGRHAEAIAAGEQLLQLHPQDKGLLLDMADLLAAANNHVGALGCLARLREMDPDDLGIRRRITEAENLRKRHRIEELAAHALTAAEPGHALEELGDLYHDLGQFNDAIVTYQRAALQPGMHDVATAKLGYVLARKEMFTEAQEALAEVELRIDQQPDEQRKLKRLLFKTAELMENEKRVDEALAVYKRVFRVDAGYRDVVERIERLQRVQKQPRKT